MVDLCCGALFDELLEQALRPREVQRLRTRYQDIFAQTVVGVWEDCRDGRRKQVPPFFYQGEQGRMNGTILVRHLIEEVLDLRPDDIPGRIGDRVFRQQKLSGMFQIVFDHSPWAAVDAVYPGRFQPWELGGTPQGYWNRTGGRERAIKATRWLFEQKLRCPVGEIPRRCSRRTFDQAGLGGMLLNVFRGSPYEALQAAYPNRFKAWELLHVPHGFWTGPEGSENAVAATRWLIEDHLGWSDAEVKTRIARTTFVDAGLGGMLSKRYRQSLFRPLEETYPGRYRPWELRQCPAGYWRGRAGRERARGATRWLVEERLGWPPAVVRGLISSREFALYGLSGMMEQVYGSSVWHAIQDAFPDRYRRDELYGYRLRDGQSDPIFRTVVARARLLVDATILGVIDACRVNRVSQAQWQQLQRAFLREGVRALLPAPPPGVIPLRLQQAIVAAGRADLTATPQDVARRCGSSGFPVTAGLVTAIWHRHGIESIRQRYRFAAGADQFPTMVAAARALGTNLGRISHNRKLLAAGGIAALWGRCRPSASVEAVIVEIASTQPGLGREEIVRAARIRRARVTSENVRTVLCRYGVTKAAGRLAAADGVPANVSEIATALRRLLEKPLSGESPR